MRNIAFMNSSLKGICDGATFSEKVNFWLRFSNLSYLGLIMHG